MIVSLFAIIVGLPPRLFAIIVRPTQTVFASPRHTVCKPLQVVLQTGLRGAVGFRQHDILHLLTAWGQ